MKNKTAKNLKTKNPKKIINYKIAIKAKTINQQEVNLKR